MLPSTDNPTEFRIALKKARLAAGLSFSELARLVRISPVMPSRYENESHSNATLPNESTLARLNQVLFPNDDILAKSDTQDSSLAKYSTDQIVAELKRRGAISVSINW